MDGSIGGPSSVTHAGGSVEFAHLRPAPATVVVVAPENTRARIPTVEAWQKLEVALAGGVEAALADGVELALFDEIEPALLADAFWQIRNYWAASDVSPTPGHASLYLAWLRTATDNDLLKAGSELLAVLLRKGGPQTREIICQTFCDYLLNGSSSQARLVGFTLTHAIPDLSTLQYRQFSFWPLAFNSKTEQSSLYRARQFGWMMPLALSRHAPSPETVVSLMEAMETLSTTHPDCLGEFTAQTLRGKCGDPNSKVALAASRLYLKLYPGVLPSTVRTATKLPDASIYKRSHAFAAHPRLQAWADRTRVRAIESTQPVFQRLSHQAAAVGALMAITGADAFVAKQAPVQKAAAIVAAQVKIPAAWLTSTSHYLGHAPLPVPAHLSRPLSVPSMVRR